MTEKDVDPFDRVMQIVGDNGRFQKIFTWVFVMGLTAIGALVYMNIILALNLPDYWCHVPGRNKTNFTLDEWKNLTLPLKHDNRGELTFSTCEMYHIDFNTTLIVPKHKNNTTKIEEKECVYGYEYDKTWYEATIPTQENWVCQNDVNIPTTFIISRIAEVIGSVVFGQLGDILGRRYMYMLSIVHVLIGRVVSLLTTASYIWFAIATVVASVMIQSFFQSPFIIAMEISRDDDRTAIAMYQSLGWSIATSLLPLLYWWLRHWSSFMWLTTLPILFLVLFQKYMIESPRWLISRKRFGDALKQFKVIAQVNNRSFDLTEDQLVKMFSKIKNEKVYGLASLVSTWRFTKNTFIMGYSWCVVASSYFTLLLFSSQMGGNPFLNFLFQSIVEIPAYIVGKYSGDLIGRRATNSLAFLISGLICIPIILIVTDKHYIVYVIVLSAAIKFLNGLTFLCVNLQAMEMYPTCLRQTGISLGTVLSNAVGALSPYFTYLGTTYDIRYPYYILAVIFFTGSILATFLPETLHQKLPDTLQEAQDFGKNQKFWSLPKARASLVHDEIVNDIQETEKLNQKQYML